VHVSDCHRKKDYAGGDQQHVDHFRSFTDELISQGRCQVCQVESQGFYSFLQLGSAPALQFADALSPGDCSLQ